MCQQERLVVNRMLPDTSGDECSSSPYVLLCPITYGMCPCSVGHVLSHMGRVLAVWDMSYHIMGCVLAIWDMSYHIMMGHILDCSTALSACSDRGVGYVSLSLAALIEGAYPPILSGHTATHSGMQCMCRMR